MQKPRVIAISGKLGSGKTTAETLLAKHFTTIPLAFADGLKESYKAIFPNGTSPYTTEGRASTIPELNISVGKFLQDFGEAGRQYNSNIWLYSVGRRVANAPNDTICVITDCRFPNEVKYIQSLGGIVVRLRRDNIDPATLAGRDHNHISETALDTFTEFDYTIDNNGTIEELETALLDMVTTTYAS